MQVFACDYCNKLVERTNRRANEALKFGWKTYCSRVCINAAHTKKKEFICHNPQCKKTFSRTPSDFRKSKFFYCSKSCAVTINNKEFPKRPAIKKICKECGKEFISREKYCSISCRVIAQTISSEVLIQKIKEFTKINGRIPLKREFTQAIAARKRFGSWNKAIVAAGFVPNQVRFSKKCIALDGHICDSLSEMIIDNFLYRRKIAHERSVPYPNTKMTADFKVKNVLIEFLGLQGQLQRYDYLVKQKEAIWKKQQLQVIKVYPKDLFPRVRLDEVLQVLI